MTNLLKSRSDFVGDDFDESLQVIKIAGGEALAPGREKTSALFQVEGHALADQVEHEPCVL